MLQSLTYAVQHGRDFSVIVTESRPDGAGYQMARDLTALNIPVNSSLSLSLSLSLFLSFFLSFSLFLICTSTRISSPDIKN